MYTSRCPGKFQEWLTENAVGNNKRRVCTQKRLFPVDSEDVLNRKPHAGAAVVPEACQHGLIPVFDSTIIECLRC